jgi:hypothetical protein
MPTPITNIHNAFNELYEASAYIAEHNLTPDKIAAIERKLAELIATATDMLNELKG